MSELRRPASEPERCGAPTPKSAMLDIAAVYERMADRAAAKIKPAN